MGDYSLTPTVAQAMVSAYGTALGASPQMPFYSGTPPANAAAALSGNTLLATLVGAATPIASTSDTGSAGRGTFGTIAPVTVVTSGTASFFRTTDSAGTTTKDQGGVATSGASCNLNTVSLTAGSTLQVSSRTFDLPYGP